MKDCKSRRRIYIIELKRNQIRKRKLREELEKYREVKCMTVRQEKHGRKDNLVMACVATEEQAELAIEMRSKTKHYIANEYKHRKEANNLNNKTQEKDKRHKKLVEERQLQETKTCYVCVSKEHLINACKKNTNLFVTNEEWPKISEEELKYFLEEYGKISCIKT